MHIYYIQVSSKSAPSVKVNSAYMKHKVLARQPCCTGESCPQSQVQYKLGPEGLTRLGNSNVLRLPVNIALLVNANLTRAENFRIMNIEINAYLIIVLLCRLLFFISIKVSQIQPIRRSFASTKQPIRGRKILRTSNKRTRIG